MNKSAAPKVFISYSHDSRAHSDRVLALAQQLRCDGIDAELDQFHQCELVHWPRWCEEQMRPEHSEFVLAVCTPEYRHRVEGRMPADVGMGVFWEGTLIYNYLYDAKGNPRFIPVYFAASDENAIPSVLKGYTRFCLETLKFDDERTGYAALYRLLTGQAGTAKAELGIPAKLPPLPQEQRRTDFQGLIEQTHANVEAIKVRQEKESKRAGRRFGILLLVLVVTMGIAYGIYRLFGKSQTIIEQNTQQAAQLQNARSRLEDVIAAVRQQPRTGEPLTPQQRYDQALAEVAFKHDLTPADLRAAIDGWTAKVKSDPTASPYDLALAEYNANHFEQAAKQADIAYDQAMQARTLATTEAIKAARLEGDAHYAMVHYDQALAAYRKAAALTDKEHDPVGWAEVQGWVTYPLYEMARYAETEPLLREILAVRERHNGHDHPKVAIDLNNLAVLYLATNRMAEAEPLMRRVLRIDEGSFGKDHPSVARDLNNLAQLLKDTNCVF